MPVLIATLADNRSFIMPMKNKKWNAQVFGRGIRWVSQLGRLAKMVLMGGSVAAAAQTLPAPAPVAVVANTNLISSASSWPQLPEARGVYDFNQGWLFWLPPPPKPLPPYAPRSADCIKQGEFPNSTSAQDVMVGAHQSRYVCLESLSSQRDTPFASVAEFWLLDEKERRFPGWVGKWLMWTARMPTRTMWPPTPLMEMPQPNGTHSGKAPNHPSHTSW